MTARLICVRHGESDNVVRRAAGALPGSRLTPNGHEQARALAARMNAYHPIAAFYASDAIRAVETARHLAGGVEVTTVPDLAEIHIGRLEGARDDATRARTAEVLRSWVVDGDWSTAVADGESGRQVRERVTRALTRIAGRHDNQTVVVVGHVGAFTAGVAALCDGVAVWGAPLPHGVPFTMEYNGAWRCRWPRIGATAAS